jgi:molybdate transport system substrate-binding protein
MLKQVFSKTRRAVLALAAAAILAPGIVAAQTAPVVVFAAASLKNALDDVSGAFTKAGGGEVKISYAASSALARQIEAGAPADVFISADADWMDWVAQRKLIVPASRGDLLTNHLALIAPAASAVRLKIARGAALAAALGSDGRLAVAGPEVPAGRYARASLTSLGLWDQVKDKLAPAENVRAALQFVARGASPLGIVYDTDARVEPQVRIVGLFPDASHPPIVYPAALTATSKNPRAAAFLKFLRSGAARSIFVHYGFIPLAK